MNFEITEDNIGSFINIPTIERLHRGVNSKIRSGVLRAIKDLLGSDIELGPMDSPHTVHEAMNDIEKYINNLPYILNDYPNVELAASYYIIAKNRTYPGFSLLAYDKSRDRIVLSGSASDALMNNARRETIKELIHIMGEDVTNAILRGGDFTKVECEVLRLGEPLGGGSDG